MKPSMFRIVMALSAVLTAAPQVYAHHGWSEYDSNKGFKLTGKVMESGYERPRFAWRIAALRRPQSRRGLP
jgi:hypothetical protein